MRRAISHSHFPLVYSNKSGGSAIEEMEKYENALTGFGNEHGRLSGDVARNAYWRMVECMKRPQLLRAAGIFIPAYEIRGINKVDIVIHYELAASTLSRITIHFLLFLL